MQTRHSQITLKPDTSMFRDIIPSYGAPRPTDLTVDSNVEIEQILSFVDKNVASFVDYYNKVKDSEKENRISDNFIHHLQLCENETKGFLPYDFRKNPTQQK